MEEFEDKVRKMAEDDGKINHDELTGEEMDYHEILNTAKNWQIPEGRSKQESWDLLQAVVENKTDEKPKKSSVSRYWLGIAASVLVIIVSFWTYYSFFDQVTTISSGISEIRVFYLPDSSKVTLNAVSSISYDEKEFANSRKLALQGHAFFEVKKGSTFVVQTGNISTEVLGTSFSIYSRENKIEVGCSSGRVRVFNKQSEILLSEGQKIEASNEIFSAQKSTFDSKKAISWTQGKFYYDNESLETVVKEIEMQFGVEIEGASFKNRYYTGYFDNENVESALKQVLTPMGYSYEIHNKSITVR